MQSCAWCWDAPDPPAAKLKVALAAELREFHDRVAREARQDVASLEHAGKQTTKWRSSGWGARSDSSLTAPQAAGRVCWFWSAVTIFGSLRVRPPLLHPQLRTFPAGDFVHADRGERSQTVPRSGHRWRALAVTRFRDGPAEGLSGHISDMELTKAAI